MKQYGFTCLQFRNIFNNKVYVKEGEFEKSKRHPNKFDKPVY